MTSLTFLAGVKNDCETDCVGNPDFALAAVTLAPIPVPAAGLLLLGGLGALWRSQASPQGLSLPVHGMTKGPGFPGPFAFGVALVRARLRA